MSATLPIAIIGAAQWAWLLPLTWSSAACRSSSWRPAPTQGPR
ncbi:hypothetical protein [Nonomuraea maritima]